MAEYTEDLNRLVTLRESGELSEDGYLALLEGVAELPQAKVWRDTLRHWFLVLGLLLIVSGVIYFGAYNWAALGKFQKFALLQAILVGLFTGVLTRGLVRKEGQALLVACAGMVGALLAVIGQVYQTGADSYTLFGTWALLLLPWCLVARSNAMWILQFGLLNTSFSLWWFSQTQSSLFFINFGSSSYFGSAFLFLNFALAAVWWYGREHYSWMSDKVTEVLLTAGLAPATMLSALSICFGEEELLDSLLTLPLALGLLWVVRRRSLPSMVSFCASLLVIGTSLSIKLFIDFDIAGLLLVGLCILGQLALAVRFLKRVFESRPKTASPQKTKADKAPTPEGKSPLKPPLSEADLTALEGSEETLPWYAQGLVIVGAWLATLFVLLFCLAMVSGDDTVLFLVGLGLFGSSVWLFRSKPKGTFYTQCLTCAGLTGISATVGAVDSLLVGNNALEPLMLLGMCGVVLTFVRDRLNQFLTGGGLLVGLVWLFVSLFGEDFGLSLSLGFGTALTVWAAVKRKQLLTGPFRDRLLSTHRGFTYTLLFLSTLSSWEHWGRESPGSKILLTSICLGLLFWLTPRLQFPQLAALGLAVFGLLTFSVPALFIAVLCYTAFFVAQDRALLYATQLSLLVSGSYYYYNLDLTLMSKSLVLLASGGLLLLLRLAVRPLESEKEDHAL